MTYTYLSGKKVYLRQIEEKDLSQLVAFDNEENIRILGDDDIPYPTSIKNLESFLNANELGKNFAICKVNEDTLIGSIAVYSVNYQNSNCEIGITISKDFQGNGFGREAMEILIHFIFMYLPMNKIKLQVFAFNPKAIHLYESLGFKHEGTLKEEIFRFSTFQDLENYALLRKNWKKSNINISL